MGLSCVTCVVELSTLASTVEAVETSSVPPELAVPVAADACSSCLEASSPPEGNAISVNRQL